MDSGRYESYKKTLGKALRFQFEKMEKRTTIGGLKQRLARMFRTPSLLRSACKPSTSAAGRAANSNSSSASTRTLLEHTVLEPVFVPRRPSLSFIRDDVVDCGGCGPMHPLAPRGKKWRESKGLKKERRVRETGGYFETGEWEGRMCPPASPSSPSKSCYYYHCLMKEEKKKKEDEAWIKRVQKQRLRSDSYGFSSSSSAESDDGEVDEFFSSDERELGKGEETETFFSSRSFSSDYTEFYQRSAPKKKKKKKKNIKEEKKKKTKSKHAKKTECPERRRGRKSEGWGGCKGFHPLVTVGAAASRNKERKRGFAVVKRSSDPYSDFRGSMVEMIVERQIFGAEDLEGLLDSYLSLNARHLHPLILQAFSDIWVVLFGH